MSVDLDPHRAPAPTPLIGSTSGPRAASGTRERLRRARRTQLRRQHLVGALLVAVIVIMVVVSLTYGHTTYSLEDVARVIAGQTVPGASFTVRELRLPRTTLALASGLAFGLAGATFQTMLRNPLASPDVIGISTGAGTGAVLAIVVLGLGSVGTSAFAIVAALVVAVVVYALSYRSGVAGTRLILIGIGVAAFLESVTTYLLSRASQWDLQEAVRWLTGSLNGAAWTTTAPVVGALFVLAPLVLAAGRHLEALQLGEDAAGALGVRVEVVRAVLVVAAVGLIAFATAAAGPVAFVAFLSGPIAARMSGGGRPVLVSAALVGACLVLVADFAGQWVFGTRYPVGVITGVLGAPYLIYLIIRANRGSGSL